MTYDVGERRPRYIGMTVTGHLAACTTWLVATWWAGVMQMAREGDGVGGLVTAVVGMAVLTYAGVALALTLVALALSIPWWCRRGDRPGYPGWALAHALVAWVGGTVYAYVVA